MVYSTEKVVSCGHWWYIVQRELVLQGERISPGIWFVMFDDEHEIIRAIPVELFEGARLQASFQLWHDFNVEHWKKFIKEWCSEEERE